MTKLKSSTRRGLEDEEAFARTLALLDRKAALERRGAAIINLGIGVSHFQAEPFLTNPLHMLPPLKEYAPPLGIPELRDEIARFLSDRFPGSNVEPHQVAVCDGGSNALLMAFAIAAAKGDVVLLPRVHYPAIRTILRVSGCRPRFVDCDERGKVSPSTLRKARTRRTCALAISTPSNPFGSAYTLPELEELADAGLPIISDEVYNGMARGMASALHLRSDTFMIGSFSKVFALPGIRVGYLVAPKRYVDSLRRVRMSVNISTAELSQRVALAVLSRSEDLLREHATFWRRQRDLALLEARANGLELVTNRIDGAFFVAIRTEMVHYDSATISDWLLNSYFVLTIPGAEFGSDTRSRFLRVNFTPPHADLICGFRAIANALASLKERTIGASKPQCVGPLPHTSRHTSARPGARR